MTKRVLAQFIQDSITGGSRPVGECSSLSVADCGSLAVCRLDTYMTGQLTRNTDEQARRTMLADFRGKQ